LTAGLARVASHADPRVDERSDQPRPDGSLVVHRVSRGRIPFIARRGAWLSGRPRPQSHPGQKMLLGSIGHPPGRPAINGPDGESSDCENLVRPKTVVTCPRYVVDIDNIDEPSELVVPEALAKREAASFEHAAPRRLEPRCRVECIQPQRLDLDGLSNSRRDH